MTMPASTHNFDYSSHVSSLRLSRTVMSINVPVIIHSALKITCLGTTVITESWDMSVFGRQYFRNEVPKKYGLLIYSSKITSKRIRLFVAQWIQEALL